MSRVQIGVTKTISQYHTRPPMSAKPCYVRQVTTVVQCLLQNLNLKVRIITFKVPN